MRRHRHAAPLALALALAPVANAASLTPPNLVTASSLNNPDLLLVWPYAAGRTKSDPISTSWPANSDASTFRAVHGRAWRKHS